MTASEPAPLLVPPKLREGMQRFGSVVWLESLPAMVDEAARHWGLVVGEPYLPGGMTSWVAPARTTRGQDVVLKITWAHDEGLHEPEGLVAWDGLGAVLLHDQTQLGDARALLLERCLPGTPLGDRDESEQDEVIVGLLQRLWTAPTTGRPFRPLTEMCDQWLAEFEVKSRARESTPREASLDPGLVRDGLELFSSLARSSDAEVLLCTDLHAGNVLAAEREAWLVIDPKPYVGDPAYDVIQHLLNCHDRIAADPGGAADHLADLLDLDRQRVRGWLLARSVIEAVDFPELVSVALSLAGRGA